MTIESAYNFAVEYLTSKGIDVKHRKSNTSSSRYIDFEVNGIKRILRFSDHKIKRGKIKTFYVGEELKDKKTNARMIVELRNFIDNTLRNCKKRAYYEFLKSTNFSKDKK